jgi:hypothetical protein
MSLKKDELEQYTHLRNGVLLEPKNVCINYQSHLKHKGRNPVTEHVTRMSDVRTTHLQELTGKKKVVVVEDKCA